MTTTRDKDKDLQERIRVMEAARRLNQEMNPPRDPNAVSQSSSAYLERKEAEARVNDQAIADAITADLAQAPSTNRAAIETKKIKLPAPLPAGKTAKDDIDEHGIPGFDEVMLHDLQDIILGKLYAEDKQEDKETTALPTEHVEYQYPRISFFSKNVAQIQHWLTSAANDILEGSQASVARVIALIKKYPLILQYSTQGRDRLGRCVKGTLLQIAAMAGDVNIRELSEEEKNHRGIVERLREAGNLSAEDVAKQLHPVLFSEEAMQANAARNKRILDAVKQFGESILQTVIEEPARWSETALKAAQEKCQLAINAFQTTLQNTFKDVITSGYLFDISILHEAMVWLETKENLDRFGSWWQLKSDIFWVNGIGSLQSITAARDAQVVRAGIGNVVDGRALPARDLKNEDGPSLFLPSSRLGLDFFLGYVGRVCGGERAGAMGLGFRVAEAWKSYVEQKRQRCKLMQLADKKPTRRCVIQ